MRHRGRRRCCARPPVHLGRDRPPPGPRTTTRTTRAARAPPRTTQPTLPRWPARVEPQRDPHRRADARTDERPRSRIHSGHAAARCWADDRAPPRALTAQPQPVRRAGWRRRRRTSPGGTGSPTARRSRRAATNGSPCSVQVATAAASAASGTRPPRDGVGVHEVEALVLDAGEERAAGAGASTVFQPMCGRTGASSRSTTSPGHSPQPCGPDAVLVARRRTAPASRRRCRAPAGAPRHAPPMTLGPSHTAPARPCTPRTRRRRARPGRRPPAPRPRSAVTVTSAPTRASARSAERRLPEP